MQLSALKREVDDHSGVFHCQRLHDAKSTKQVEFRHLYDPPQSWEDLPDIPKLADFYDTFSNLLLYHDPKSDEAAFYIASPDQWQALDEQFRPWLEIAEDEEDALPPWIDDCIVIGEIPATGNYLLMPLSGEQRGGVFEFEHDGFEFIERAPDIEAFVRRALAPSAPDLVCMASHLRFIEDQDPHAQWWILQMQDNRGHTVSTE
jgi:hypothetical protein